MIDLDQPGQYAQVDRADMIGRMLDMPAQVRAAWSATQRLALPPPYAEAANVVICGMGGSAIGGDLTRTLAESQARCPIVVVRGYDLPRFVGPESLVVLSSFSGATEETLSARDAALAVGARVLAITTGGVLAQEAGAARIPVVRFAYPGQPREAIGYSTLLMLGVLARLGYVADCGADVEELARLLHAMTGELGPNVPTAANPAKQLAQRLRDRIPVVYGGGLMAEVARRWKGQFNENAKHWAFFEQLPELDHNAVLGYQFPTQSAERVLVVMLSSSQNHPRITLREQITGEILVRHGIPFERVEARGASPLEQLFSATYCGDFTSYYLALLNGVDPSDIETINYLKARLSEVP